MANRKQRRANRLSSRSSGLAAAGSSALSLGVLILSTPAYAQEQASASSDDTIAEIVVTGIRESLKSAQAIKQNAEQLVDSVTAQDIGALPDRSVSEALQRIPGITLQRTNTNRDPARLASEGGGVFIRGLSWVRSETNGRDIFSANNGRDLSFEDVSADLLAGIDVYKNPSADMVEGGIGGIVNLRTRLPLDSDKRLFAVSADYNYADLKEEGFFSANALYSDRWDTGAGKFGILLSGSYGNVGNRTDSVQAGRFEERTLSADEALISGRPEGSHVYIPNAFGWRSIDWEQKRTAFAAAIQWAPNDDLTFTIQGLKGKADPQDIEHTLGDTLGGYPAADPSYTYDDQGAIVSGTLPLFRPQTDTRFGSSHKTTSDYSFNVKYALNDQWSFSGDYQYVTSHADVISLTAFTELGGNPANSLAGTLDFDLGGDTPHVQGNIDSSTEKAMYWWEAAMDHLEDNDAQSRAARMDAEFTFDDNPWLKSFKFGVRATNRDALTRQTNWNWALLSNDFWFPDCCRNPTYLDSTGYDAAHQNAALPNSSELFTFPNFFRGDVNLPGVAWFPTAALVSNGGASAYDILKNTQSSGWGGWQPYTADSFATASPFNGNPGQSDNVTAGINNQGEETRAAYAVLRFGRDESALGRFDGNIGVRLVKTESDAIGQLRINAPTNVLPVDVCIANNGAAACQGLANAVAFSAGVTGDQPGFGVGNSYTDVLPTLNLRFHLKDDLQLRFAVGKAIVRPTFSQMMPYTSLSFKFEADGFTPDDVEAATATGGNPKLKPTQSTQFDTSLEWYFAPTGSVTFAAFYKDVKDYIFLGNSDEDYVSNGITQSFDTTRNFNGSHGKIKGFEVAYQQFYDKLPGAWSGLGLQANFTFVDSSGGRNTAINILESPQANGANDDSLPLEGLSKTSYNVAAMYEKYGISARLAYNWRERYLLTTSAANIQRPVWFEDYGQLDGSVFYSLTPKIKLGIQATNLLNTRTFLDVGGTQLAPRYSWTDTDRRFAVAIRTSF